MSEKTNTPGAMHYAGLATQWMAMLLVAVWAGYKLDARLGWAIPVCTIVFPLVALGVSLWQLMNELNRKRNEK